MKVKVNDDCISCGLCQTICPAVFKVEEGNGISEVVGNPDENATAVYDAAATCPVNAIEVEE